MSTKTVWQTCIAAFSLVLTLSSCFSPQSFLERDAPELGKTYVLIGDATLTSEVLMLPGPLGFGAEHTVRQLMSPQYYRQLKRDVERFGVSEQFPYPDEGKVRKGARLELDQVFLYSDVNATVRYGRGQLSDPERGEYTVYLNLESPADISSVIREVE